MLNNWGAYSEIAKKSDELAAREKAYDEEQARKNEFSPLTFFTAISIFLEVAFSTKVETISRCPFSHANKEYFI